MYQSYYWFACFGWESVPIQENINVIKDGLLEDYDGFVTSITTRLYPYSIGEFEFMLLAHGARLLKYSKEAFLWSIPPLIKLDLVS